jgi:hypothetical protein
MLEIVRHRAFIPIEFGSLEPSFWATGETEIPPEPMPEPTPEPEPESEPGGHPMPGIERAPGGPIRKPPTERAPGGPIRSD